jgi:hypothetical protein
MFFTSQQLLILDTFGSGPVCLLTLLFLTHASSLTGLPISFLLPVSGLHLIYSAAVLYNWRVAKNNKTVVDRSNVRMAFVFNLFALIASVSVALTSFSKTTTAGKFVLFSFGGGAGFFASQLWNHISSD